MSSIRVQGLTRRYGAIAGAFEVSFDVPSGGTLALLGPSDCGQTTIIRCLAGLETPEWGSIEIDGTPVFDRARAIDMPPERRDLGVVFQSYAVWPHMTVAENVAFPLKVRGVPEAERLDRAGGMLEQVGLKGFGQRSASLVSVVQQHRIALARALVHQPKAVLFDEPLSSLDSGSRRQMRTELRLLQERLGFTAIYATHDLAEALGLAEDIVLLNGGAVEAHAAAREMFAHPRSGFAARFFGMNVLEGRLIGPAADSRYLEVELSARLVVRGAAAPEQALQEGGRVLACIRKEAVRVTRARRPEEAPGVIVTAAFMGSEEAYVVDITGVRIEAVGPAAGLLKGDRVNVTMTPDQWVFLR